MPANFYSRIPAAAVFAEIDGNKYARVPHRVDFSDSGARIVEDLSSSRMVRFNEPQSFIRNGEAWVWIGRAGDSIQLHPFVPFGASVERA